MHSYFKLQSLIYFLFYLKIKLDSRDYIKPYFNKILKISHLSKELKLIN